MNILITGGAGFIGCNFIRMMVHKYPDCEIKVLDNLSYSASLDNLRLINFYIFQQMKHMEVLKMVLLKKVIC